MNAAPAVPRSPARPGFLVVIVVLSLVTIVGVPLFTALYQYPKMRLLLRDFTLNEAVGMARDLTTVLVPDDRELDRGVLTPEVSDRLARLEREANFFKLKIYSAEGRVLWVAMNADAGEALVFLTDPS